MRQIATSQQPGTHRLHGVYQKLCLHGPIRVGANTQSCVLGRAELAELCFTFVSHSTLDMQHVQQ